MFGCTQTNKTKKSDDGFTENQPENTSWRFSEFEYGVGFDQKENPLFK